MVSFFRTRKQDPDSYITFSYLGKQKINLIRSRIKSGGGTRLWICHDQRNIINHFPSNNMKAILFWIFLGAVISANAADLSDLIDPEPYFCAPISLDAGDQLSVV